MSTYNHGEPLAQGRTASIYAWRKGSVLKLYHDWFPSEGVEYEARIARAISSTGLRVPDVGEIVEVNGRLGLEYERVDGVSMGDELRAKPWALGRYSSLLASLHAELHEVPNPGTIPTLKDKLKQGIKNAPEITEEIRITLLHTLKKMPDGRKICHGDFHPDNILLTKDGPVVIDWIDASIGSPPADIARTSILVKGKMGIPGSTSMLEKLFLNSFHRSYRYRYFQCRPGGEEEYSCWLPLVAAARLSEGIEELAPWLKSQAERIVMVDRDK